MMGSALTPMFANQAPSSANREREGAKGRGSERWDRMNDVVRDRQITRFRSGISRKDHSRIRNNKGNACFTTTAV